MQKSMVSKLHANTRLSLNGTPFAGLDLMRGFIDILGYDYAGNTAITARPGTMRRLQSSG